MRLTRLLGTEKSLAVSISTKLYLEDLERLARVAEMNQFRMKIRYDDEELKSFEKLREKRGDHPSGVELDFFHLIRHTDASLSISKVAGIRLRNDAYGLWHLDVNYEYAKTFGWQILAYMMERERDGTNVSPNSLLFGVVMLLISLISPQLGLLQNREIFWYSGYCIVVISVVPVVTRIFSHTIDLNYKHNRKTLWKKWQREIVTALLTVASGLLLLVLTGLLKLPTPK